MSETTSLKINLERIDDNYLLEAKGKTGDSVLINNLSQEGAKGTSPMELLLMGIGGCSAIDIIFILKKQRQNITSYKVDVEGVREKVKEAKPFKSAHVNVHLEGDIQPDKAKRAAQLSFEKYCSVSITMEKSVPVTYSIFVNGKEI